MMSVGFYKISKFLLYLAPFAVVVVTPSTLFPFIVGKYTFFKIVIELALIMFVLGIGFQNEANRKSQIANGFSQLLRSPLVIAVTLFVAIFVLAGFTGINPHASFWSNFERGEGSFLMLHFFVFFLLLLTLFTKESDWKILFKTAIAAGILVMLYGAGAALKATGHYFQSDSFLSYILVANPICDRFAGSLGNPAYIGTVSIFLLFYVAYLLVSGNWRSKNWQQWSLPFLVFLGLYFIFFLMLSQTRGGFLGLGVSTILALLYLVFTLPSRKWRLAVLGTAVALVLLGSFGVYYRQHINLAPWCGEGANRILDVSLSGATIGTRFALWQQAVDAWKERPIFGWGPENFSMAFEKYYNPIHKVWFDRAHNIFFDYLIFAGALGLLSFIGMFATFYWCFFTNRMNLEHRTSNSEPKSSKFEVRSSKLQSAVQSSQLVLKRALLFSLPVGYLVQGLVLFDVLPIYINLFLFLAFASWRLSLR